MKLLKFLLVVGLAFIVAACAEAQEPFYKGKTVRLVVGFSAGGGFDVYSRAISRHLGKHLSGNPTVIVENMTGAGSLVAANHIFKVAKPDGLTIGNINGGIFVQQLLGWPGIEFDALKFEHLGVPVRDKSVCVMTKASGFNSFEKWTESKTPLKLGGTGPGSATHNIPLILKEALNLPIQLVSGYKGIADVRLAAEGGELAGVCGWTWDSLKATWTRALESGDAMVVLQTVVAADFGAAKSSAGDQRCKDRRVASADPDRYSRCIGSDVLVCFASGDAEGSGRDRSQGIRRHDEG